MSRLIRALAATPLIDQMLVAIEVTLAI